MTSKDIALCSTFAVALPLGQMLFKWGAIYDARLSGHFFLRSATNIPLISAFAWYGLTALLWFYILTRMPLSLAYPFSLAGSALVPLLAGLLFKEPFGWRLAVGYVLILAGLLVISPGPTTNV